MGFSMTYPSFEPFKIKTVESLPLSTPEERAQWIAACHYNIFSLRAEQITFDLLTDSGTSAMSDRQWSAMMSADESYAGSRSFFELETTARELTGLEHILPVHQGRAAEHVLFSTLLKGGELIPSNGLFDTTYANIHALGASGVNLPCMEAEDLFSTTPFKGNMHLEKLEQTLKADGSRIPLVIMTITNNTSGGQPADLDNIRKAAEITHAHKKLFVIDGCRFAENAYFIKLWDSDAKIRMLSPLEISQRAFSYADIITFSGKKDAFASIGGLLCVRDKKLAEDFKTRMVVVEGFPTYGGLAGYSLAAMNQGLKEVVDADYLAHRIGILQWMADELAEAGIPVLRPAGGHAIFLESSKFYPHIQRENLPGIALLRELYVQGGIRGCELGTVAFGRRDSGRHILPAHDLVRLAIPRRTYSDAHMRYVVECIKEIHQRRNSVRGYEFLEEATIMRNFRSTFRAQSQ